MTPLYRLRSSLLLLAVVAAVVIGPVFGSFTGTWTDTRRYGHGTFLCETNGILSGSFSEYGIIRGTVNGDTAEGNWYETCVGSCCRGTFKITLSVDGQSYSGWWACVNEPSKQFTWSENRDLFAFTQTPNSYQCAQMTSQQENAAHRWQREDFPSFVWDVCSLNRDSYESSYVYRPDVVNSVPVSGYESGGIFESGKVIQGTYRESSNIQGASLSVVLEKNQMLNFYWQSGTSANDFSNPVLHDRIIYDRIGSALDYQCNRNRYLAPEQEGTSSSSSYRFSYDSAASSMSPTIQLLAMVVLVVAILEVISMV